MELTVRHPAILTCTLSHRTRQQSPKFNSIITIYGFITSDPTLHQPSVFSLSTPCSYRFRPQKFMASDAPRRIQPTESENKVAETRQKEDKGAKSIPPPPEKPLPDDCCGSGCVRCVWDVYYDELEAYQKLLQNNTPSES